MPFDAQELRRVMGTFCTGVTVITTCDDAGRPFGLTANAITSLSLNPPLVLICVDRKAESHAHFFTSKVFVVNVLSEAGGDLASLRGLRGRSSATSPAVPAPGRPRAGGTLAHLECRIVATHEGGDR
jgi:flavin reductase (DIM6/NTAB) family NADH-FMN oxidoreductase RutF